MKCTEIEVKPVKPIVKRNFWAGFRKPKIVELQISNLGTHPIQISNILTDLDKLEVKYLKTDNEKDHIHYPIVVPEKQSRKIGIAIKWFCKGTDLCKVPLQIYTNDKFYPEDPNVFACEAGIQSKLIFWLMLLGVAICGITLLKFLFSQSSHDVFVSSKPQGQHVIVSSKRQGQHVIVGKNIKVTTPTLLKLDADAEIQIGDSGKRRVRDVLEDGCIFFPNERWHSQTEEKK